MVNLLRRLAAITAFFVLYGVLEYKFQFFTGMAEEDPYFICYTLYGMFWWACIDSIAGKEVDLKSRLPTMSFIASMLGLLGTFLGMAGAFHSVDVSSLDPANPEMIKATMATMFDQMYIAMNTTICGILVSIPCLTSLYLTGSTNEES